MEFPNARAPSPPPGPPGDVTLSVHRCVRHVDAAGEWCALSVPLREVVAVLVVDGRTSGRLSLALLPR
eukprot:5400969-Prymnesium_polylepis.1